MKDKRTVTRRRLDYVRPLVDIQGRVVGYLDGWGNAVIVRIWRGASSASGGWEWS